MNGEKINGFGAIFRFVTPLLVTITLFVVGQIWTQVNDLNVKMYAHATNSDLHIPRSELTRFESRLDQMQKELTATIRDTRR